MRGWRRELWSIERAFHDQAFADMPSLQSAMVYPGLVAFEASNLSVGREPRPHSADRGAVAQGAGDGEPAARARHPCECDSSSRSSRRKAPRTKVRRPESQGIRILVTNRTSMQPSRVGAALLWAINKTSGANLTIDNAAFDLRFGSPSAREALMRGDDPDAVIDKQYAEVFQFRERTRRYHLYR